MRLRDNVRRAGRSLRQAKARTLLTSLAISVGAFTVTVALAAGSGGQAYTDSLVKNNGDSNNLMVFAKMDDDGKSDTPKEYGAKSVAAKQGIVTDQDIAKISKIDGVGDITPEYSISAAYMTRGDGAKKYETSLSIKADRTALPLVAGSLNDNQIPAGKVVIPEAYLEVLGFEKAEDAIDKKLVVHIEKTAAMGAIATESEDKMFTIAAVDKKSSTVMSYSAAVRVSIPDGRDIYKYQTSDSSQSNEYYALNVRVKDGADLSAVQDAIKSADYTVYSLKDMQEMLFQFINIVQWGAAGFGFLAILASIFGIINTQYISVLERTQQIGLMKALGARRKDVGRLFRYEAAWVGFLGGSIGTIFAVATSLFNPAIAKALSLEDGTQLLQFSPITSVILIASLMLVAVVAGYFPARKAARLDPIEALRTE